MCIDDINSLVLWGKNLKLVLQYRLTVYVHSTESTGCAWLIINHRALKAVTLTVIHDTNKKAHTEFKPPSRRHLVNANIAQWPVLSGDREKAWNQITAEPNQSVVLFPVPCPNTS